MYFAAMIEIFQRFKYGLSVSKQIVDISKFDFCAHNQFLWLLSLNNLNSSNSDFLKYKNTIVIKIKCDNFSRVYLVAWSGRT